MSALSLTNITVVVAMLLAVASCAAGDIGTTLYDASMSSTYDNPAFPSSFSLQYIDLSGVSGKQGSDIFQIGEYYGRAEFGMGVTFTGNAWEGDGVLALGQANPSASYTPVFDAITDADQRSDSDANILANPAFALLFTETGGELQLGGYLPESVTTAPVYTPVLPTCTEDDCSSTQYVINIDSFRLDGVELLGPTETIVDSGYSCLTLPSAAYQQFQQDFRPLQQPTIEVVIGGTTFTMEFGDYFYGGGACVDENTGDFANDLVLGDPFFVANVVIHDLNADTGPRIGVAPRDRSYSPTATMEGGSVSARAVVDHEGVSRDLHLMPVAKRDIVFEESVAVTTLQRAFYFTTVTIGTPRQAELTLQIDTGSSLTIVHSADPPAGWGLIPIMASAGALILCSCCCVAYIYLINPSATGGASGADRNLV